MASAAVDRTVAAVAVLAVAGRETAGGGTGGRNNGRLDEDDDSGASIAVIAPADADSASE